MGEAGYGGGRVRGKGSRPDAQTSTAGLRQETSTAGLGAGVRESRSAAPRSAYPSVSPWPRAGHVSIVHRVCVCVCVRVCVFARARVAAPGPATQATRDAPSAG